MELFWNYWNICFIFFINYPSKIYNIITVCDNWSFVCFNPNNILFIGHIRSWQLLVQLVMKIWSNWWHFWIIERSMHQSANTPDIPTDKWKQKFKWERFATHSHCISLFMWYDYIGANPTETSSHGSIQSTSLILSKVSNNMTSSVHSSSAGIWGVYQIIL